MTAMKWFYSFLKKHNASMALGLVMVTIISVLAIVKPIVSGSIVDDVITGGNFDLLPKLIALLIIITVLRGLLRYWSQVIFETCSQDVLYSMRDTVYRKLLQEDFNFYNKKRTGDLLSRQTGDMDAIRHFIAFVIYQVYENVFLFFFALIMIFTVSWKLYVRGAALRAVGDVKPDEGRTPALSENPRAVLLPQHLRAGECQRKPRSQGVLEGGL